MLCFDCFSQKSSQDDTETIESNITIKIHHYSKKQYTLLPLTTLINTDYKQFSFSPKKFDNISYPWIETKVYEITKIFSNETIPIIHIINKNAMNNKNCIIYNHTFSHDIGTVFPLLIDMSSQFKCNVISYDFTDFEKNNSTSIENSYITDLENVIDFCVSHLNLNLSNLILMSKSFGSIPVLGVVSKEEFREIKGIIMISPISRGFTLKSKTFIENYDILQRENAITAKAFLIHGKKDKVIPIEQSDFLTKFIRNVHRWSPKEEDHSNLMTVYRKKFFNKVKKFINDLNYTISPSLIDLDLRTTMHSKQNSMYTRPSTMKDTIDVENKKRSMTSLIKKRDTIQKIEKEIVYTELNEDEYSMAEKTVII